MKIYIVNFNDQGNYAAYTSEAKAKEVLWETYCEEIPRKQEKNILKKIRQHWKTDISLIMDGLLKLNFIMKREKEYENCLCCWMV